MLKVVMSAQDSRTNEQGKKGYLINGDAFKKCLYDFEWSQAEFSKLFGISEATTSRIVNGKQLVTEETFYSMSKYLMIEPENLGTEVEIVTQEYIDYYKFEADAANKAYNEAKQDAKFKRQEYLALYAENEELIYRYYVEKEQLLKKIADFESKPFRKAFSLLWKKFEKTFK